MPTAASAEPPEHVTSRGGRDRLSRERQSGRPEPGTVASRNTEWSEPRALGARFEAYGDWRKRLAEGVAALYSWLREQELVDAQADLPVAAGRCPVREEQLIVAFVAEFSRGKSELINALFFADFGARLLPATAGRTTMCPTEPLFDPPLAAVDPPAADRIAAEGRDRARNSGIIPTNG